MAEICIWIGGAEEIVAQVDKATPAVPTAADVSTMTLTGEDGRTYAIEYITGGGDGVAEICDGLVAAWDDVKTDDDNLWSEVTVTDDTTHVTITANSTAGVPFALTCSVVGTGTLTRAAVTANSGPNDVGTLANYSNRALPVAGDTLIIEGSAESMLYGLAGLATGLLLFENRKGCTTQVGAPRSYLAIDAATVKWAGTGRGWIDLANLSNDVVITAAGKDGTDGTHGLNIKGGTAAMDLDIRLTNGQTVGIAAQADESATFVEARITGPGTVHIGDSTGLTHVVATDQATVYCQEDLDTLLKARDATVYVNDGTPALIQAYGGARVILNAAGTHPKVELYDSAYLDGSQDQRPKTISALEIFSQNARVNDPNGVVTFTAGYDVYGALANQIIRPPNRTWTDTAI